jgi:hypothetical protein
VLSLMVRFPNWGWMLLQGAITPGAWGFRIRNKWRAA